LTSGHPVNCVVDEDDGYIFSSVGGVNDFGHADGGQVAVTLIGEDDAVRKNPLQPRGYSRRSSMRRFDHVDIKILVNKNGATYSRDADGPFPEMELVEGFSHEAVDRSMMASRTEMKRYVS
jgi:hypothetical protein